MTLKLNRSVNVTRRSARFSPIYQHAHRQRHRSRSSRYAIDNARVRSKLPCIKRYAVLGVDLTAVPTLGIETVLVVASEIGPDLSRFPSSGHFCSWLSLAPPTRISGGKPLPGKTPKVLNRAGQALRQAAANARNSDSFIGASHRARLARMDTAKAIKATAHQLARLIYAMLTQGQPYVEQGIEAFEVRSQARQLRALQRKAARFGLALVDAA